MRGVETLLQGHDPVDLEGQAARAEERKRQALAAMVEDQRAMVALLSQPWGRRMVRRQLLEAGLDVRHDTVGTVFDSEPGRMAFKEGARLRGLQLLWTIVRMAATGKLPADSFSLLFREEDEWQ